MNCTAEENNRLSRVLKEIGRGYETGDFTGLYPFLREDCVLTSHWVLTDLAGRDNIVRYYDGKGEALRRSGCCGRSMLVQLAGRTNPVESGGISLNGDAPVQGRVGIRYRAGKYCLLMTQELNGETVRILVDIKLDEEGMVREINLCEPAMFAFRRVEESGGNG